MSNIVKVQFKRQWGLGGYTENEYAYIADNPVAVGDIVRCPTRYGESEARISRINVPETEVPTCYGDLKHITEPASVSGGLFDGFY